MTFAEKFCVRHGVAESEFEDEVLDLCLYPAARVARVVLAFLRPDYFAADFELVRNAGRLTHTRDFSVEASLFWHHPANSGWLRRGLRLRLSTHRVLSLMKRTMETGAGVEPRRQRRASSARRPPSANSLAAGPA